MNLPSDQVRFDTAAIEGLTIRATRSGLVAAGVFLEGKVVEALNRQGTPTAKGGDSGWDALARGQRLIRGGLASPIERAKAAGRSVRARRSIALAESVNALGGLVDPPGGMPRKRTGNLQRTVTSYTTPTLEAFIGATANYAAAQEWGANLPGGQPFIIIRGKFIPLKKGRKGMGVTKPSRLPARPYLRPTFQRYQGEAFEQFVLTAKRVIEGGR